MKEYHADFWIMGDYDDMQDDFDTLEEAVEWVKDHFDRFKRDSHDDKFGYRITKVIMSDFNTTEFTLNKRITFNKQGEVIEN